MYKRQLLALEYPTPDKFNVDDIREFRNILLWLEDQKIRHYKIEDRASLRKMNNDEEWNAAFEKYKNDLMCPPELTSPQEQLRWIMIYAVKLEYVDNIEKYKVVTAEKIEEDLKNSSMPSFKSSNPFDNMDFNSKDFETAVRDLAKKLKIPDHPNHLITLSAISKLIKHNLNKEALKEPLLKGNPYPIFDNLEKDEDVDQATRILRLLHIQSIRELQTVINETIVSVQNLTADPKTDTKLGKVGF